MPEGGERLAISRPMPLFAPVTRVISFMASRTPARARAGQHRDAHRTLRVSRSYLETRELAYFVAVAEELHFGRAAQRLGMAQPPLSRAIQQLERRMGVTLLERTSRGVT